MTNPSVQAEAAVWLARLRSEERTAVDEAAFRAWLNEDERHAVAFEHLQAAWDAAGAYVRMPGPEPLREGISRRLVLGASAGLAAAAAGVIAWVRTDSGLRYRTGPRERRQFALADRTQVTLDGDSAMEVRFSGSARQVTLERGRAYFDVAHDPSRPFIARAAGHEVIALGTAFEIDHASAALAVLLVEGKVAVRSARDEAFLRPGDRLVIRGNATASRDRPDLARLTAWQRGQLIFDGDRLVDAVAQMNRYSSRPMAVADPLLRDRQLSGAFSTGDPGAFARSVGLLLDVPVAITSDRISIGQETAPAR